VDEPAAALAAPVSAAILTAHFDRDSAEWLRRANRLNSSTFG
jgi:hypothetical protein